MSVEGDARKEVFPRFDRSTYTTYAHLLIAPTFLSFFDLPFEILVAWLFLFSTKESMRSFHFGKKESRVE